MRIDEKEIKDAMNRRLSSLDSSINRRDRIHQLAMKEEEPIMKKKVTAGLVFAIVAVLALTGAALALGVNLFEYFSERDARYAQIAPQAELATQSPITIASQPLGTTNATIQNAYYDGKSLLVGYSIENSTRIEAFAPTDAQLANMQLDDTISIPGVDIQSDVLTEYYESVKNGTPFGYVLYSVYPSDHTETDDGFDLPPMTETEEVSSSGARYVIREYENPLPQEVQDRDELNIQIRLWQSISYHYFDGTDYYFLTDRNEADAMTANIKRADEQEKQFEGSGAYNGIAVSANASASSVHASLTITGNADSFQPLAEDSWYYVVLMDESGNSLMCSGVDASEPDTLTATFEGTGKTPGQLTAYILICSEGDWDEQAAMEEASPIELVVKK